MVLDSSECSKILNVCVSCLEVLVKFVADAHEVLSQPDKQCVLHGIVAILQPFRKFTAEEALRMRHSGITLS